MKLLVISCVCLAALVSVVAVAQTVATQAPVRRALSVVPTSVVQVAGATPSAGAPAAMSPSVQPTVLQGPNTAPARAAGVTPKLAPIAIRPAR